MTFVRILALAAAAAAIAAGQTAGEAPAERGGTRAGEIEQARNEKAASLSPDLPGKLERKLLRLKDEKLLERLTSGIGNFGLKIGGMPTGSGMAGGPQYSRSGLAGGRIAVEAAAVASMRGWTKAEMGLAAADPLSGKWVVDLRAARYDYRSLSYYGAGPDSSKEGRSNYRLEDTAFDASAGWRFRKGLLAGLSAGYERARTGEGEDSRYAQAGRLYAGDARPFGEAMGFTRTGAFFQADQRDNPAGARRGGLYTARFDDYRAGAGQPYSFQRLDLEAQHYQPLFNQRRVIALRARTIQSFTSGGNRVPFFHQAVLGGSDDLRGFRPYRFQDDNLLVVNAEYRWEVFSGLDMAVFGDAGRVSARRWDFSPRDLETSAGFGLRFNARNATFLRVDVGFSHEGFQVFVKFNQVYRERRLGTSTAPHLY